MTLHVFPIFKNQISIIKTFSIHAILDQHNKKHSPPGYRANLRIIELLGTHPKDSFRLAMFTLKLWAKQHFVSGGQFGLLNGTTMTLLFVHIFLKHPEESVPALLAHFFDVYSRWYVSSVVSEDYVDLNANIKIKK